MGVLIRALKSSPLARPLPAVAVSALGLGMIAFTGLCATAPGASEATLPVLLPLTALANRLGAPILSGDVINVLMYGGMTLCALGLAGMLWANSLGWNPNPRRVFWTAVAVVAVVVCITPVGTSDPASYASYGRIAALGHNPYIFTPADLPGGVHNPYTALVDPRWRTTPSVYGPVATWTQLAAALVGGARPWLTIWALMIMTGIAFLAAGYLLLRSAANPVRAGLIWAANPLLIYLLVMGAQLDVFLALVGIAAILISRRGTTVWHDLAVGALIGVAAGIKVNAVFVALGIAVPLIRERAWARLLRTSAFAAVATLALYFCSYGVSALKPLPDASSRVISPSVWRLFEIVGDLVYPGHQQAVVVADGRAVAAPDARAGLVPVQPAVPRRARRARGHLRADLRLGAGGPVVAALVHRARLGHPGPAAAQLADPLAHAGHLRARDAALQRRAAGQPPGRPGAVGRAAAGAGAVPGLGRGGRRARCSAGTARGPGCGRPRAGGTARTR